MQLAVEQSKNTVSKNKLGNLQILKYDQAYKQNIFCPPGDSLSDQNGMEFTTSDNDNDERIDGNCADAWGSNWWGNCGWNSINGKYGGDGDIGGEFMWWWHFDNNQMSLKTMTLMVRQAD